MDQIAKYWWLIPIVIIGYLGISYFDTCRKKETEKKTDSTNFINLKKAVGDTLQRCIGACENSISSHDSRRENREIGNIKLEALKLALNNLKLKEKSLPTIDDTVKLNDVSSAINYYHANRKDYENWRIGAVNAPRPQRPRPERPRPASTTTCLPITDRETIIVKEPNIEIGKTIRYPIELVIDDCRSVDVRKFSIKIKQNGLDIITLTTDIPINIAQRKGQIVFKYAKAGDCTGCEFSLMRSKATGEERIHYKIL